MVENSGVWKRNSENRPGSTLVMSGSKEKERNFGVFEKKRNFSLRVVSLFIESKWHARGGNCLASGKVHQNNKFLVGGDRFELDGISLCLFF